MFSIFYGISFTFCVDDENFQKDLDDFIRDKQQKEYRNRFTNPIYVSSLDFTWRGFRTISILCARLNLIVIFLKINYHLE
jgi:hypothetical protein